MKRFLGVVAALTLLLVGVGQSQAGTLGAAVSDPTNDGPPAGPVILDLAGTPILGTYSQYSATFVASSTSTNVSFAFREDPAFLVLSNVVVADNKTPATNLLLNGDFSLGPVGANQPTDWTYLNTFGASFAGVVTSGGAFAGGNTYVDGAVQAYDGITQAISTVVGDTYTVSFYLYDTSPGALGDANPLYQDVSTNGDVSDTLGNGRDLLVYAGAVPTASATPEPASLTLLGIGIAGLAGYRWKRRKVTAK
jgi:hypothetical protein